MLWPKFQATWSGTISENRFLRGIIAALLLVMVIWGVRDAMLGTIVTVTPPGFDKPLTIGRSHASESLYESFSWSTAELLGNVTPANVESIKQFLEPLLSPDIYQSALDELWHKVEDIKQDRVTYRFDPRKMIYEEESGKYFVTGYRYVSGPAAPEHGEEKTYELMWIQRNYRPLITSFTFYSGAPRTREEIRRQQEIADRQRRTANSTPKGQGEPQ